MSKNASAPVSDLQPHERRRFPRKPALLCAVITAANGEDARDCMILDINAGGAQVSVRSGYPNGAEVYLLDVGNEIAHYAKVAWSKADRRGLSFVQTHKIGLGLPTDLTFLWKLLLKTKLQNIELNIGNGVPAASAFLSASLSELDLGFMAQRARGDAEFELALYRARQLLHGESQQPPEQKFRTR